MGNLALREGSLARSGNRKIKLCHDTQNVFPLKINHLSSRNLEVSIVGPSGLNGNPSPFNNTSRDPKQINTQPAHLS